MVTTSDRMLSLEESELNEEDNPFGVGRLPCQDCGYIQVVLRTTSRQDLLICLFTTIMTSEFLHIF